jgi:hypothetical protein
MSAAIIAVIVVAVIAIGVRLDGSRTPRGYSSMASGPAGE